MIPANTKSKTNAAGRKEINMLIVTTEYVSGKETEMLGLVKGSTIQTVNAFKDIGSAFKTLVGGELVKYNEMMAKARSIAMERMTEEAEKLGEISASVTHNHPEGIKGAKVVAGCILLLRDGKSKNDIREYVKQYYDLDFTLDEIRDSYTFDVSCQGSVPQAVTAFLEGESFADVIANAISIGGDSDTIAAIAGSIAEVIYPIPQGLRGRVIDRVDNYLLNTIVEAVDFMYRRLP